MISYLMLKWIIMMMTIILIVQGEANHDNEEDSMMTIPNDNSIKKSSLRQRFEIMTNKERFHINNNITHILMPHNLEQQYQHLNRRTRTTFRPSSAILYLHPPKPQHIESIETHLTMLNLTSDEILVGWEVVVHLRVEESSGSSRTKRKIEAKVEEEQNPLSFILYIRKYGTTNRERYQFIDKNNTLDSPITNNKTYQYRFNGLESMTAYELCLQSVNAGQISETIEISRQFPINALTELAGRNNPLFVCKEIVLPSPSSNSKPGTIKCRNNENRFTGRSGDSSNQQNSNLLTNTGAAIQVSEEVTDRFVVYTAITTGTTTVFVLVVMVIFCCCRCHYRRRNIDNNKNGQQQVFLYDQVGNNNNNMIPSYYDYRN